MELSDHFTVNVQCFEFVYLSQFFSSLLTVIFRSLFFLLVRLISCATMHRCPVGRWGCVCATQLSLFNQMGLRRLARQLYSEREGRQMLQALSQSKNPNMKRLTNADTKDSSLFLFYFSLFLSVFLFHPFSVCIKEQIPALTFSPNLSNSKA